MSVAATAGDRLAASVPPLADGVCQVWWARPQDVRPEHDALLDEGDLRRRSRLIHAADRQRTTAGTAVARMVLAVHAGCPRRRLRIERSCPVCGAPHGKPRLPEVPGLHFSVSHTTGCVVVAITRNAPVGVDVEEIGRWQAADLDEVAALTLAPEERAVLSGQPAGARAVAFTTYWARKEAVVKATGAGLRAPLDEIVVSPPACPPRVVRWRADDGAPPHLHALRSPPGHAAALAVAGAMPTTVVEQDAGVLLRAARSGAV